MARFRTRSAPWVETCVRASAAVLFLGLLLAGCASPPKDYPRTSSTAFPDYQQTSLGRFLEEPAPQHPDRSGFTIIRHGRPAFVSRIALADLAENSLDLQYYLWEGDATGWIFAERMVRAADRGVRVRILVDDIGLEGRDAAIAAVDAHPNIEIRVFNPFVNREARIFDFLTDIDRVNHRMHNKLIVADNAVAIVGGRNIGNHYYDVATDANFRDLDIAAAGPVVREISTVFDYFWNGDWAVPIGALVDRPFTTTNLKATVADLRDRIAGEDYPYPLEQKVSDLKSELAAIRDDLIWAPGHIVWDDPAAIEEGLAHGSLDRAFYSKVATLQDELLIEAAYFVPRERGVEGIKRLTERGVRVRVLTNSLASNDVVAAHAGHAKYREDVIESGAEVYEIRPDAGVAGKSIVSFKSKAALHTKALVFDRQSVFIGSFNLDPRSANINTEAGLYVESPELAAEVVAYMDEGVRPENSYRVLLNDEGDLVWVTEVDGQEVRYRKEPETTFGQRFLSDLIMSLPVHHQL